MQQPLQTAEYWPLRTQQPGLPGHVQQVQQLWHSYACVDSACPLNPICAKTKHLWHHISECGDQNCQHMFCASTKHILSSVNFDRTFMTGGQAVANPFAESAFPSSTPSVSSPSQMLATGEVRVHRCYAKKNLMMRNTGIRAIGGRECSEAAESIT